MRFELHECRALALLVGNFRAHSARREAAARDGPAKIRIMSCLACDLISGQAPLPGGRLHETSQWVVEHCVGPLGLGSLIVKPRRHVTCVADLDDSESSELGPLLQLTAQVARALTDAEQVYVCLWSHAGAVPGHIHYVVQPVTHAQVAENDGLYGPALQVEMFRQDATPSSADIERVSGRARALFIS
jgi:diadenosine tetraphosphate (Ap4A) HIT family hydrolase